MVNREMARGILLTTVALYFIIQASQYQIGSFRSAGPGLFPLIVAGLLLIIGIAVLVRAIFLAPEPLDFRIKNIALIVASFVSFALVSQFLNMFIAIGVMVFIASLASDDFSIKKSAVIALVLCVIAVGMKDLLGVQLPLY